LATPLPPGSEPVKLKLGVASLLGSAGCAVIEVSGAVVSTSQVKLAGEASVLPALSIARTEKVCDPSAKPVNPSGLVQAANEPASSLHSKLATPLPPGSETVKLKLGVASLLGSAGCAVIE